MRYVYLLLLKFYGLLIFLASLWNKKAALFINGRRGIFKRIANEVGAEGKNIWIHCSSLGEYEQGRPLIGKLKERFPDHKIILTLFSPSGYEHLKKKSIADHIYYLPLDGPSNASKLVRLLNPKLAILVKYEYWFYYLHALKRNQIPIYVVSAIFRENMPYFKWYGLFFRKMLNMVEHFFVQDTLSQNILYDHRYTHVSISGDTRFDTVWNNKSRIENIPAIQNFAGTSKLLIAGSTWPDDDKLLCKLLNDDSLNIKMIIAPHEIQETQMRRIENACDSSSVRYSQLNGSEVKEKVLIIDNIGMLSSLYASGDITYIGGGFGKGIHNVLEAAVFGKPLFFGPRYEAFREATELVKLKGAYPIKNYKQLQSQIKQLIDDPARLSEVQKINSEYVARNKGASEVVINYLSVNGILS